jgi:hypothetical protein
LRVLGCALAAFLFLLAVARSGTRYFYCPMMNATFEKSCCHRERHEVPTIDLSECCKERRLGSLPSGAPVAVSDVGEVPLLAVLPPFESPVVWRAPATFVRSIHPARDGPAERRAELMIWNC